MWSVKTCPVLLYLSWEMEAIGLLRQSMTFPETCHGTESRIPEGYYLNESGIMQGRWE